MEKPVEIVEKCEFSTAIPEISNLFIPENPLNMWMHKRILPRVYEIMSPLAYFRYREKFREKVSKMPKAAG